MIKKLLCTCCGLAMVGLLTAGCTPKDKTTGSTPPTSSATSSDGIVPATTHAALTADICGKCGCCAGCDECCKEGAEKCEKCGFQEGTELCCAEGMSPKDVAYCKDCGHVKGSEACCKDECEVCDHCGLHKGSDLCCKIKETE